MVHESQIDSILEKHQVGLVVGAGYMRVLDLGVCAEMERPADQHPSCAAAVVQRGERVGDALQYGVKISGCTTHFMDEEMDHGPIILQAAVKVLPDDTRDTLARRILEVEHQVLPRTIELFMQGRLVIEGRHVRILPGDSWKTNYECYPEVLYSDGY